MSPLYTLKLPHCLHTLAFPRLKVTDLAANLKNAGMDIAILVKLDSSAPSNVWTELKVLTD